MISEFINAVVHLFSLFLFGALFFLILKWRRERDLLRDYLTGNLVKRVQVDWPLNYLSRFCSAVGIPFSGSGSLFCGSPKRLRKELLFETLLLYGIDAIQYKLMENQRIQLTIQVPKRIANREVLQRELSSALEVEVRVVSSCKI